MTDGEPTRVRIRHSIRVRVVVGLLAALTIALLIVVVITRQLLLVGVDESIDRDMAQEVEELRNLARDIDPESGQPFGDDARAILWTFLQRNVPSDEEAFYSFIDGRAFYASFDAPEGVFASPAVIERWTTVQAPTRFTDTTSDGEVRALAVPLQSDAGDVLGVFVVAVYPASAHDDVNDVVRTIGVVALIALVLTALLAWTIAGRVLLPVRDLTDAVKATDAEDLSRRIPVSGADEMAELGHRFNAMLDRLEGSFRDQRDFLNDVAHELRTPITIVRGHLEMLDDDPRARAETLALVTDELDRMGRYITDLLVVARASQPNFLRSELIDVGDIVDDVITRATPLAERAWTRGRVPTPGDGLTVADGDRLTQAMLALVTNAIQHTDVGDRIELGASANGVEVSLWVRDSGVGIDPSEQERIFTRFSRGAGAESGRPDGAGLGLPIVAAIARAHQGRIELDSRLGEGATFRIIVPRRGDLDADETNQEQP